MPIGEGSVIAFGAKIVGALGGAAVGLVAVWRAVLSPFNKLKKRVSVVENELNDLRTDVEKNQQKLDHLTAKLDEHAMHMRSDLNDVRNNELAAIRNWLMTIAQHANFSEFSNKQFDKSQHQHNTGE